MTESAYSAIRDLIINGELGPGQPVSIDEMAEELGVSPTPVREALIRLSHDGLIEYNPRKKARVSEVDRRDIEETYEVRKVLEPYLAEKAAKNPPMDHLQQLEEKIESMDSFSGEEKYDHYHETDIELNNILLEGVENDLIDEIHQLLENITLRIRFLAESGDKTRDSHIDQGNKEHLKIVEKIEQGDPEGARAKMVEHLKKAEARTLRVFDETLSEN